jgi:hypothetical protein
MLAQLRIGQVHAENDVAAKGETEPNDLAEVPTPPTAAQPASPQQPATKLWVPGQRI